MVLTGAVAMVTVAAHQSVASWLKCVFKPPFSFVIFDGSKMLTENKDRLFFPFGVLEIDRFPSDHQHAGGKERTLQGKTFKPGEMIFIYPHSQL